MLPVPPHCEATKNPLCAAVLEVLQAGYRKPSEGLSKHSTLCPGEIYWSKKPLKCFFQKRWWGYSPCYPDRRGKGIILAKLWQISWSWGECQEIPVGKSLKPDHVLTGVRPPSASDLVTGGSPQLAPAPRGLYSRMLF